MELRGVPSPLKPALFAIQTRQAWAATSDASVSITSLRPTRPAPPCSSPATPTSLSPVQPSHQVAMSPGKARSFSFSNEGSAESSPCQQICDQTLATFREQWPKPGGRKNGIWPAGSSKHRPVNTNPKTHAF